MKVQNNDTASADLLIVGAGVNFPEQLTAEALEALTCCEAIFTIVPPASLGQLPSHVRQKCVSLWPVYEAGRKRRKNYEAAVEAIWQRIAAGQTIAYLTPGHPLVFDSVSEGLRLRAAADGFRVRVVPGISCIDTILADVGYEPANGLVVHEATAVVQQKIPLDARFAFILLQLGVFGTDYARLSGEEPLPDLAPLQEHVRTYYPSGMAVAYVRSRWGASSPGSVTWTKVDSMVDIPKELVDGTSLFIPRADYRGLSCLPWQAVMPSTAKQDPPA